MSNLCDVITYESSVVNAMCKAEHQLPCILNSHKRVIETVMTTIYCVILDEVSTTNKNARKGQIVKIAHILNTIAYGTPTDHGTYRVPYDPKTGFIGEVKFDYSQANGLKEELNEILPLLSHTNPTKLHGPLALHKYRQSSRFCQRNLTSQMMRLTTLCVVLMIGKSTGLHFVNVRACQTILTFSFRVKLLIFCGVTEIVTATRTRVEIFRTPK
jgi:hypothetical protein